MGPLVVAHPNVPAVGIVMDLGCHTLRQDESEVCHNGKTRAQTLSVRAACTVCHRSPREVGQAHCVVVVPYGHNVYLLSVEVCWVIQDLKDYMRQAGEVTYADAHKQRRNEGVVEFASFSDMKNAIDKLDDTDLSGRRIKLVEDRSRRRRSRSRSRSKSSRSYSRSRSHSRSKSRSMSKSRSRSKSHSKSRSRSKSPAKARSSQKHSHSRSRSMSEDRHDRKSRSRSKSHKSRSRSRSLSRSPSRSKSPEKRMDSPVPKDDVSNSADDKN